MKKNYQTKKVNTQYVELALKLKALADRGVGGERYNAQKQLDRIMKRYGITMEMLQDDTRVLVGFKVVRARYTLFLRIGMMVTGMKRTWFKRQRKPSYLYVEVTRAEEAEIRAKYNFYSRVWEEELDIFFHAFAHKNGLYPTDIDEDTLRGMQSSLDRVKAAKILMMADNIEKTQYTQQLPDDTK